MRIKLKDQPGEFTILKDDGSTVLVRRLDLFAGYNYWVGRHRIVIENLPTYFWLGREGEQH